VPEVPGQLARAVELVVAQDGVQRDEDARVVAVRVAAQRLDAGGREAALAEEFAETDATARPDAYYALIARFDAALDAAVSNDYLTAALRTVRTHLVRVRRLARDNPARLAASVSEHRLIAAAIAGGDGDLAAHATHVHLHNALIAILDSLEGTP
jgi:DNA-binding GntR family transcriptional regulator